MRKLCALLLVIVVAGAALAADSLLQFGPKRWTYLLLDRFITADAAPIASPRTCEPGPGTLTVSDAGNHLSISGGALVADGGEGSWGEPAAYSGGYARAAGRTAIMDLTIDTAGLFSAGWASSPGGLADSVSFYLTTSGMAIYTFPGGSADVGDWAEGADYTLAFPLRSTGGFHLLRGGAFGVWTLMWVDNSDATATLYAGVGGRTSAATLDNPRVVDIPSWSSDAQVYTSYKALPVATNTDSHMADCWLDWTQTTVPSGGTQQIDFRRASETERWYLTLDSAGAITLYEDTGGSDTSRGTWTGVVNGNRIMVLADSTTIKVYVADTLRITYASASTNATATTWYVTGLGTGGAIADLYAWPRYPAFPGGV